MPWDSLYRWPVEHHTGETFLRFADAEQAKATGGMVALYPRVDDALKLAIPGGEPVQELHVTLAYLGEDVSDLGDPGDLHRAISDIANRYTVIDARCMGHATFNPDGGAEGDKDPCGVYLISDNEQLPPLHDDVLEAATTGYQVPTQHTPWVPHLTAGYGLQAGDLHYTGPILFDRIGVEWANTSRYYPLLGSNRGEYGD